MPSAGENTMPIDQVDRTIVTHDPARTAPGGAEMGRRIMILVFGLIQVVIGARVVLLLLDAREANALVSAVLNISQVFVAPFEGILRTDALSAAGSVLDLTAIVAFVGWTILELIVLWVIRLFERRSSAAIG
jgi:hypothetical protein